MSSAYWEWNFTKQSTPNLLVRYFRPAIAKRLPWNIIYSKFVVSEDKQANPQSMDTEYKRKRVAKACQRCRSMKSKVKGSGLAAYCFHGWYRESSATDNDRHAVDVGVTGIPARTGYSAPDYELDQTITSVIAYPRDYRTCAMQYTNRKDYWTMLFLSFRLVRNRKHSSWRVRVSNRSLITPSPTRRLKFYHVQWLANLVANRPLAVSTSLRATWARSATFGLSMLWKSFCKPKMERQWCKKTSKAMTKERIWHLLTTSLIPPSCCLPSRTRSIMLMLILQPFISLIPLSPRHLSYSIIRHLATMTLPRPRAVTTTLRQRYHVSHVSLNPFQLFTNIIDTICAIGAYYRTLPGKEESADSLNEKLYSYALALAPASNMERSLAQVSLLLARCFYLLVVCRTERLISYAVQTVWRDINNHIAVGQYLAKPFVWLKASDCT